MLLDATITTMLEDTQGVLFLLSMYCCYLHTTCILLDNRLVAFFDIDNTLYSANHKIAEAMGVRIQGKWVTITGSQLK